MVEQPPRLSPCPPPTTATTLDQTETKILQPPIEARGGLIQSEPSAPRSTSSRAYSPSVAEDARLTRRSGRGIRRLVTLCGTITQLVAEYDRRLVESEPDDNNNNENNSGEDLPPEAKEERDRYVLRNILLTTLVSHQSPRRRNRDYQSYLELVKLIPSLKDRIADPHDISRALYYYAQVSRLSCSS